MEITLSAKSQLNIVFVKLNRVLVVTVDGPVCKNMNVATLDVVGAQYQTMEMDTGVFNPKIMFNA